MQDRFADSRRLSLALLLLTGWGAVFSGWLTYLEAGPIGAWCQWCIGSAWSPRCCSWSAFSTGRERSEGALLRLARLTDQLA